MWSTNTDDKTVTCGRCEKVLTKDDNISFLEDGTVGCGNCVCIEQEENTEKEYETTIAWYRENYPTVDEGIFEHLYEEGDLEQLKNEWVVLTDFEDQCWCSGTDTKEKAQRILESQIQDSQDGGGCNGTEVYHFGKECRIKTIILDN